MVGNKGTLEAPVALRRGAILPNPLMKNAPDEPGRSNSATKALRALDYYLLLVAGAAVLAFLAWWCFMA